MASVNRVILLGRLGRGPKTSDAQGWQSAASRLPLPADTRVGMVKRKKRPSGITSWFLGKRRKSLSSIS